eukprot:1164680-Pyramimonas_sp.AAC.1
MEPFIAAPEHEQVLRPLVGERIAQLAPGLGHRGQRAEDSLASRRLKGHGSHGCGELLRPQPATLRVIVDVGQLLDAVGGGR